MINIGDIVKLNDRARGYIKFPAHFIDIKFRVVEIIKQSIGLDRNITTYYLSSINKDLTKLPIKIPINDFELDMIEKVSNVDNPPTATSSQVTYVHDYGYKKPYDNSYYVAYDQRFDENISNMEIEELDRHLEQINKERAAETDPVANFIDYNAINKAFTNSWINYTNSKDVLYGNVVNQNKRPPGSIKKHKHPRTKIFAA